MWDAFIKLFDLRTRAYCLEYLVVFCVGCCVGVRLCVCCVGASVCVLCVAVCVGASVCVVGAPVCVAVGAE